MKARILCGFSSSSEVFKAVLILGFTIPISSYAEVWYSLPSYPVTSFCYHKNCLCNCAVKQIGKLIHQRKLPSFETAAAPGSRPKQDPVTWVVQNHCRVMKVEIIWSNCPPFPISPTKPCP